MPIAEDKFPMLAAVASNRDFMRPALASMMPTSPQDEYFERLLDDAMTAGPTLVPNARTLTRLNQTDRLGEVRIPTLILFGLKDIIVSLDAVRRTHSGIKDSRLEVWSDCGHSPVVKKPREFTDVASRMIMSGTQYDFLGIYAGGPEGVRCRSHPLHPDQPLGH